MGKWFGKERRRGTFDPFLPGERQKKISTCAEATEQDVDIVAVEAAWRAWETWKDVSPEER